MEEIGNVVLRYCFVVVLMTTKGSVLQIFLLGELLTVAAAACDFHMVFSSGPFCDLSCPVECGHMKETTYSSVENVHHFKLCIDLL